MFTFINLVAILYYLSSIHSVTSRWNRVPAEMLEETVKIDRAHPGIINFAYAVSTVLIHGMSIYVAVMTGLLVPDQTAKVLIFMMLTVETLFNLRMRGIMTEALGTGNYSLMNTPDRKPRHAFSVVCDIVCIAVLVYITGPVI